MGSRALEQARSCTPPYHENACQNKSCKVLRPGARRPLRRLRCGLQAATEALARRLPARAALPGTGTPAGGTRGGTTALACAQAPPPSRFAPGSERRVLSAPVALHERAAASAQEAAGTAAAAGGAREREGDAAHGAVEDLPDAVYDRLQARAPAGLHQSVSRGRMSCVPDMRSVKGLPGSDARSLIR